MVIENILPTTQVYFSLIRFFIVLGVGVGITRLLIMPVTERILLKGSRAKKSIESVTNLVGLIFLFLSFVLALQAAQFGNLLTVLGAITAALTVAVGFGMRDQISNLVAGFLIYTDNPFLKGDYIKVNDTEGVVKKINLRYTVLNGGISEKKVVPNSYLTLNPVENFTRNDRSKAVMDFKIPVNHLEKFKKLAIKEIKSNRDVLDSPEPEVSFGDMEEDKINLKMSFWIKSSRKIKRVRSDIMKSLTNKKEFEKIFEKKEK